MFPIELVAAGNPITDPRTPMQRRGYIKSNPRGAARYGKKII